MAVNEIGASSADRTGAVAPTPAAPSATSVDYDSFLKLLVAQMQNQDPLKPMESTEYVAQLASFSQVEQSVQINSRLDSLLVENRVSQAASMIGRTVIDASGTTGEVTGVRILSDGLVATLTNGTEVLLGPGVTVL